VKILAAKVAKRFVSHKAAKLISKKAAGNTYQKGTAIECKFDTGKNNQKKSRVNPFSGG
jgi:hypothetical protein